MFNMLSTAPYTLPAMQGASTLLHSQSYVSYGHHDDLKERSQTHINTTIHVEDEEMTYCSDDSQSGSDSFGESDTTPETSLGSEEGKLQNVENHEDDLKEQEQEDDVVSNKPVVHEDEAMEEDRDEAKAELDLRPKLSEWESQGGLMDINAAFEGTMLFDATLEEIAAWCAPLVWKLFLRQEPACSKSKLHRYHLASDTPCPPTLPKLLTKAMPRYKGGMTRSIAVTHALLYLHRINVCFHCNGQSRDAIAKGANNANNANGASGASGINGANGANGANGKNADLRSRIERNFQSTGNNDENRISDNAYQCSLFFAVGMHFASLWLLDCCPADIKYWKNYVHCVPASHGIPWFRLVLRQWQYNITVSVQEWLFFSAQVLAKVPFKDEATRAQQLDQSQSQSQPQSQQIST